MFRQAAALALALCVSPSWLSAQTTEFTVKAQSATVHKGPSTGSPVIGRAPSGTVLQVARDLGSWVRVVWPDAADGIGYVHQSMGTLSQRAPREERLTTALQSLPPAPQASPAMGQPVPAAADQGWSTRTTYIPPPTHFVGVGGRIGRTEVGEFGAGVRIWSQQRIGIQVEVSRSAFTSELAAGRLTSVQFSPSVVYSLKDHVSDNLWVRPYVGGGSAVLRSSLKTGPVDAAESVSATSYSYRVFGGTELTFPGAARLAVSAEAGYLWRRTPFPGFEVGGLGVSVAGHWYVK
jgi:hypothetical protein